MKCRLYLPFLFPSLLCVFFLACSRDKELSQTSDTNATTSLDESFVTNTRDTTFSNAVVIKYSGTTATVTNPFASSGVTVTVNNGDVEVKATTTTTEVNYVIFGKSGNGSFKLYSDYKFGMVLNGVYLIHNNGPAINIQSSKKVSVNVVGGTSNRLVDATTYATSSEDQKGTFFSEGQLAFSGKGSLEVTANNKHGICSDGYIAITEGNITVTKAASDGLHANDYFRMDGGTVNVTSSGDGIECEKGYAVVNGGSLTINCVDDGLTTSYSGTDATVTPYLKITGGTLNITTTGDQGNALKSADYTTIASSGTLTLKVSGKGSKGIKTGGNCTLSNGTLNITTTGNAFYDTTDKDVKTPAGINCNKILSISQGNLTINSSGTGGKGISVDKNATIDGGTIQITTTGGKFTYGTTTSEAKAFKCDSALVINSGTLNISSADDGLKSEKSVTVNGGTINISNAYEGIEAPYINLNKGTITINASDDSVNATKGNGGESNDGSLLTFGGATVYLNSTGGDSVDSNGSVAMTGGTVVAQGPQSAPEVALDYNGTFNITGGIFIASGPNSGNMIQAVSTSSGQYCVLAKSSSNLQAGTLLSIQSSDGSNLLTYAPVRNTYYFVFSSPSLVSGATYKIYTGGSYTGGSNTNGFYSGGTYNAGTQKSSFTIASKVSNITF
ncbi:MAG: carbohydrate-binding domain-containing protein [Marinilabiliales bacterium]|nr:carbohydrate-binding domain-containing protein [Marinilabiliales bacterium]